MNFSLADESISSNLQPDGYKLSIWNNKDLTRDTPMIIPLSSKIFLTLLNNMSYKSFLYTFLENVTKSINKRIY